MQASAGFWDKIADKYSQRPIADEINYQKKLETTRTYFHPETEVLELGCGTGSTALLHAPYVKQIHAVDISPKMLAIAQQKAKAQNINNISFECASISDLKVADQSYDVVLCLSVLHLVEDRAALIASIYKMLRPGGVFISSTACLEGIFVVFKWIGPIGQALGLLPLIKVFTRKSLEATIQDSGFELKESWQPGKNKAVFVVAKKSEKAG